MRNILRKPLSKEMINNAQKMDLLTYLKEFEPHELVYRGHNEYTTVTHDSLKISNGMWRWFSRGISHRSALDYLIHVKGMEFYDAVVYMNSINRTGHAVLAIAMVSRPQQAQKEKAAFILPVANTDNRRVIAYLLSRGIGREIIDYCITHGMLYESKDYHNAVFVGKDNTGKARFATQRGTHSGSAFRVDVEGSDKRYSFSLAPNSKNETLYLFESAIDALSHATLYKMEGRNWQDHHRLSLSGITVIDPEKHSDPDECRPLPAALATYLESSLHIKEIIICMDNDEPGRIAAGQIIHTLQKEGYGVKYVPPPAGKDYNDHLKAQIQNLRHREHAKKEYAR